MERQLAFYPRPKYWAMFMADKNLKSIGGPEMGKSEFLNDIVESHYRNKPEAEQQKLLAHHNNMVTKKAGK